MASRAGNRDGNRPWRSEQTTLFVVGIDGASYRQLHAPYVSGTQAKVAWSLDGKTVTFVREGGDRAWEVMAIPREGGIPELTGLGMQGLRKALASTAKEQSERLEAALDSLDLHPDGSSILFSSVVNPKMEVWALEGVSAAPRQR